MARASQSASWRTRPSRRASASTEQAAPAIGAPCLSIYLSSAPPPLPCLAAGRRRPRGRSSLPSYRQKESVISTVKLFSRSGAAHTAAASEQTKSASRGAVLSPPPSARPARRRPCGAEEKMLGGGTFGGVNTAVCWGAGGGGRRTNSENCNHAPSSLSRLGVCGRDGIRAPSARAAESEKRADTVHASAGLRHGPPE
jgi:hypothetical protein